MQNLFGYSRVLAIGDVHGMYEKLIKLMDKIRFNPDEDLLIFLGDQWVMNLPVKYQYQDYFFCHAGVDPDVPLAVQNEFDMLWRRQQWWEQYKGEETLVVGHTPVQKVMKLTGKERRTPKPLFLANHVIMCDTGAYMSGGKLSCVDVLAGKVWQA